ncbi:MAG TPA: gamma-glutamylcyclotransferase family protein [Gammaproteobacteria bacterium]
MNELFCYGTLCAPNTMRAVIGRVPPARLAVLPAFACYRVSGKAYPGVVADQSSSTEGFLYSGLTDAELKKLDAYEGGEYLRQRQTITTFPGRQSVQAWVYVIHPLCRARLSRTIWKAVLPQIGDKSLTQRRKGAES